MATRVYKCLFLRTGRPDRSVFHPRQKGHWKYFYSLNDLAAYINDCHTRPAYISNLTKLEEKILKSKINSIFYHRHPQYRDSIEY